MRNPYPGSSPLPFAAVSFAACAILFILGACVLAVWGAVAQEVNESPSVVTVVEE